MKESYLTLEMIKRALEIGKDHVPYPPTPLPLHPSLWEDYKKTFNLTDSQMDNMFIKTEYIEP